MCEIGWLLSQEQFNALTVSGGREEKGEEEKEEEDKCICNFPLSPPTPLAMESSKALQFRLHVADKRICC